MYLMPAFQIKYMRFGEQRSSIQGDSKELSKNLGGDRGHLVEQLLL